MAYSEKLMITVAVICFVSSTTVVVLRVYARRLQNLRLGMDDYLIFPALALAIAETVIQIIVTRINVAVNELHVSPEYSAYQQFKYALQMASVLNLGFVKASIVMLYIRIFSLRWFRIIARVMLVIVVAWTLSSFFGMMLQCSPISTTWTVLEKDCENRCMNRAHVYYAISISNIITDLTILVIPLPVIWKLQIPTRQKFAVSGIFFLGALTCAASITRAVMIHYFIETLLHHPGNYMYTAVIFWTVTEGTLAIISACLPTLRPLFDRRNKTKLSTSRRFKIRYWSASQGNRDSDSSVVGFGTAGLTIKDSGFHTHIEANRMENLRHSRDGIMVRKDISLQ